MKHVFRVSSHLTFYLSKKIIELNNLDLANCIFFLVRNYNIPLKYQNLYKNVIKTSYNVSSTQGRIFAGINFLKTRKNIKEFDNLVDGYIKNNPFIWYAQICNDDFCSLMVSKPNCKGYYVIEDGLGSYHPTNRQTFTGLNYWIYKLILKPIYPRLYCVKNYAIFTDSPKFLGCIATNSDCFPLHQQYLQVTGNPFEETDLDIQVDAILSIDPFYIWIDDSTVQKVFKDLAEIFKTKNYKNIYCKFHPYLDAEILSKQKEIYKEILEKNIEGIHYFEPDVVLENIFSRYKCDFITIHSTVCLYANKLGSKCYTINPLIKKYKPDFIEDPIGKKYCLPII